MEPPWRSTLNTSRLARPLLSNITIFLTTLLPGNSAQENVDDSNLDTVRPNLQQLYNPEQSLLSFEGQQMQGSAKIMEKLGSLTFQKIQHIITTVDCQPMFDGGILVNVLGQLKVNRSAATVVGELKE